MNKGERPRKPQARAGANRMGIDHETLAIAALKFLAEDPGRAERFFSWSGLDPGTIRAAASQPGFGVGILQFLMQDEPLLIGFAEHAGFAPADLSAAYETSLHGQSGLAD